MIRKTCGAIACAAILVAVTLPIEGCGVRGLRTLSRVNRPSRGTPKNETVPPLEHAPLDPDVAQTIKESREWFEKIKERYNETGTLDRDPEMVGRLIEAWKNDADVMEKPKTIRMSQAIGIAMGDEIKRRFGLEWSMIGYSEFGFGWGLGTTNGLFAVYPDDIADDWVCGRSTPSYSQTMAEVRDKMGHAGPEPVQMRGLDVMKTWDGEGK